MLTFLIVIAFQTTTCINGLPNSKRYLSTTTENFPFKEDLLPDLRMISETVKRPKKIYFPIEPFNDTTAGQTNQQIWDRFKPGGKISDSFDQTSDAPLFLDAMNYPDLVNKTATSVAMIATNDWSDRICAAVFVSPLHIITSAQCCVRISTTHNSYIATRTADPFPGFIISWLRRHAEQAKVEILTSYYYDDFLTHKSKDICVAKTGNIQRAIVQPRGTEKVTFIPPAWPRMNLSAQIVEMYGTGTCFAFTYNGVGTDKYGIPAVPVNILNNTECKEIYNKKMDKDQFCMSCKLQACNKRSLNILLVGGPVICDGTLVGIMISFDRRLKESSERCMIATRIDYHEHFIYAHLNLYPATPGTLVEGEEEEEEEEENQTEVKDEVGIWLLILRLLQILALGLAVLLIGGLLLRYGCWLLRLLLRKIARACDMDPEGNKWTQLAEKQVKVHYRAVGPLYLMIWAIMMYIFQKYERYPKLKPKRHI